MTVAEFQEWLNAHGAALKVDGLAGAKTRAAILQIFTNPNTPAVSAADIANFATALDCSPKQINAVAKVESAGGGFTKDSKPKILFERHIFHRLTSGKYSVSVFSDPKFGGYGEDSWAKLCLAACKDPEAAFSAASWGKFQVLGSHWSALGYASPLELAYSLTRSETAHYELLVRFIRANKLEAKLRAISTNADANRPFCKAYNGAAFERNQYHTKLAREMA